MKEREKLSKEERKIMDYLSTLTAGEIRAHLIDSGGHPKPKWGKGDTWRGYYLQEIGRKGKKILEELGWSSDDSALYTNIHTGCVESLKEILTGKGYRNGYESYDFYIILEHWKPYDPSVLNHYRIAYLQKEIARIEELKRKPKKELDSVARWDIRHLPALQAELEKEQSKSNSRGD